MIRWHIFRRYKTRTLVIFDVDLYGVAKHLHDIPTWIGFWFQYLKIMTFQRCSKATAHTDLSLIWVWPCIRHSFHTFSHFSSLSPWVQFKVVVSLFVCGIYTKRSVRQSDKKTIYVSHLSLIYESIWCKGDAASYVTEFIHSFEILPHRSVIALYEGWWDSLPLSAIVAYYFFQTRYTLFSILSQDTWY